MKVVFISNFMNHHQLPFSKAMLEIPKIEYNFIATTPVPTQRLKMGYYDMNREYDFVVRAYEDESSYQKALSLSESADVVITGSAPEIFIKERLKKNKLTFKYSERIYKIKSPFYQMPIRAIKYFWHNGRHKSLYLLCASAFTAADYAKTCTFLGKTYKWAYFPELKKYDDINLIIDKKKENSILWVGRLIDWKHPEIPIKVAQRLKKEGYKFSLKIIGTGEMEAEMTSLISKYDLNDSVELLGAMRPEKVREYMENSQIYLFTSDRQEGWGAVLNESMNSGCAVVASDAIGSVPFLLENGENGFIYRDGDIQDIYAKVKYLLDNPEKAKCFGKEAYKTLCDEWNAENAANRFIYLAKKMLDGDKRPDIFAKGVCSRAEILKDRWFQNE